MDACQAAVVGEFFGYGGELGIGTSLEELALAAEEIEQEAIINKAVGNKLQIVPHRLNTRQIGWRNSQNPC